VAAGVAQHAQAGGELEQRRDREARAQEVVAAEAVRDHRATAAGPKTISCGAAIMPDIVSRIRGEPNRLSLREWATNLV
jgi:hypothetical protein